MQLHLSFPFLYINFFQFFFLLTSLPGDFSQKMFRYRAAGCFFPRGHCPQEIPIYDRKYLWHITFLRRNALNITVFNQMYHIQLVIRDIYTFKGSINVKVLPKWIVFSQEINHTITRPQEVTRKKHPDYMFAIICLKIFHFSLT